MEKRKICLLDLDYTLVSNQQSTRMIRPFSSRMKAEEYRTDLIEMIKNDYVIIITARPNYQERESLENIFAKTGFKPDEYYFNDINADPPTFKESALKRFVFPKHGTDGSLYYAVESNPRTRAMYSKYDIVANPYDLFKTAPELGKESIITKQARTQTKEPYRQMSLFDFIM